MFRFIFSSLFVVPWREGKGFDADEGLQSDGRTMALDGVWKARDALTYACQLDGLVACSVERLTMLMKRGDKSRDTAIALEAVPIPLVEELKVEWNWSELTETERQCLWGNGRKKKPINEEIEKWMNEWTSESVKQWIDQWTNQWINQSINELINQWMD